MHQPYWELSSRRWRPMTFPRSLRHQRCRRCSRPSTGTDCDRRMTLLHRRTRQSQTHVNQRALCVNHSFSIIKKKQVNVQISNTMRPLKDVLLIYNNVRKAGHPFRLHLRLARSLKLTTSRRTRIARTAVVNVCETGMSLSVFPANTLPPSAVGT